MEVIRFISNPVNEACKSTVLICLKTTITGLHICLNDINDHTIIIQTGFIYESDSEGIRKN